MKWGDLHPDVKNQLEEATTESRADSEKLIEREISRYLGLGEKDVIVDIPPLASYHEAG